LVISRFNLQLNIRVSFAGPICCTRRKDYEEIAEVSGVQMLREMLLYDVWLCYGGTL
jgi:hypothetical protein